MKSKKNETKRLKKRNILQVRGGRPLGGPNLRIDITEVGEIMMNGGIITEAQKGRIPEKTGINLEKGHMKLRKTGNLTNEKESDQETGKANITERIEGARVEVLADRPHLKIERADDITIKDE